MPLRRLASLERKKLEDERKELLQSIKYLKSVLASQDKRLEIVVELEVWKDSEEYTRTGLDENTVVISEVEIPYIKLPIIPGKNITVISEVIALNYLSKHYGYDAAKIFQNRLSERIKDKNSNTQRSTDYFEHDFE